MTRETAKQNLIDFGIAEPTAEQITNYLNQINGEVTRERNRADKYKADADKANELQKQLDDIAQQNMSEIEIEKKRADDAEAIIKERETTIAQLQKDKLIATLTSKFAEKGLTGEHYTSVINAYALLGEEEALKQATTFVDGISNAKEELIKKADDDAKRKLLEDTPNPGGGTGSGDDKEEESYAAKRAKRYSEEKMKTKNSPQDEEANATVDF